MEFYVLFPYPRLNGSNLDSLLESHKYNATADAPLRRLDQEPREKHASTSV